MVAKVWQCEDEQKKYSKLLKAIRHNPVLGSYSLVVPVNVAIVDIVVLYWISKIILIFSFT